MLQWLSYYTEVRRAMSDLKPILESSREGDILVLTVASRQIEGEETAQRLKEELTKIVEDSGLFEVVLDLAATRYLSSIAFWPLLTLRKYLVARKGRLVLCGLTGAVEEVFMSTKMISSAGSADAPFEVAANREAAVAKLRGG
jgi:anti-anti-sigma factor